MLFDESISSTLSQWKKESIESNKPLRLFVGVDIGGTNTRVSLAREESKNDKEPYINVIKFQCNDTKLLIDTLTKVGDQIKAITEVVPVSACLDAAGPIQNQSVSITNYSGNKELHISELPSNLFPENTVIINDLESTCEGITAIDFDNLTSEYFQPLWSSSQSETSIRLNPTNYVVLAMGTGLGCGLLVGKKGRYHEVLPLEMGHTFLTVLGSAHPNSPLESRLFNFLSAKIYNREHFVEWEDTCSGRGLRYLYEFFAQENQLEVEELTNPEIVSKATEGNLAASQALLYHYKMLIRSAQNLCVGLQAKGVFLAGDNQVYNDHFVSKYANELKDEFLNHSKKHWIEEVPVYRQVKLYNLNLHGCMFVARRNATNKY